MKLREFQQLIEDIYGERDRSRGLSGTFMWFTEEVGELCRALRRDDPKAQKEEEFADVLAWLSTLASMQGVDLEAAAGAKYSRGCPRCTSTPCSCPEPTEIPEA
jgi:NTP pyrophosphatase (non-canonical NTP hydrolase)